MKLSVEQAVDLLLNGEAVAVPTETVYGLAAVATIPAAIARVFEIKNRPADNPLICHFHSVEQVQQSVSQLPEPTRILMKRFSPGPVSFLLDLPEDSPLKFATCGRDQVIVRIPDHPLFLSIIRKAGQPIAAPSANTSGKISATTAEMVEDDLGSKIAGVVDGGTSKVGLESTILDARSNGEVFILRPGAIGEKEISEVLTGSKVGVVDPKKGTMIPGSRYRHYAPDVPVFLIDHLTQMEEEREAVLIMMEEEVEKLTGGFKADLNRRQIQLLSPGSVKDIDLVAKNFYKTFSAINHLPVSKAFFLRTDFGPSSLGKALQNRLEHIVSNNK